MLREIECVDLNNPFLKSIEFYDGDNVFGYLNYSLVIDRIEINDFLLLKKKDKRE